jgi:hypothetical protein
MQFKANSSEADFVATFLLTEFSSQRFRERLLALLRKDAIDPALVETPDLSCASDNALRKKLFAEFRGYGVNKDMFENFPNDIRWSRVWLERDELKTVRYIRYSYWDELSSGSRTPLDAAENIKAGKKVFNISNDGFLAAAKALEGGARFPELILVRATPTDHLVVLEGHLRLTAYMLAPSRIPEEMEVMLGESPQLHQWDCY